MQASTIRLINYNRVPLFPSKIASFDVAISVAAKTKGSAIQPFATKIQDSDLPVTVTIVVPGINLSYSQGIVQNSQEIIIGVSPFASGSTGIQGPLGGTFKLRLNGDFHSTLNEFSYAS